MRWKVSPESPCGSVRLSDMPSAMAASTWAVTTTASPRPRLVTIPTHRGGGGSGGSASAGSVTGSAGVSAAVSSGGLYSLMGQYPYLPARRCHTDGVGYEHEFEIGGLMAPDPTWTDAELTDAIRESITMADALRRLRLRPVGGNYVTVKRHIARLGLDTSHLLGHAWARGRTG